MNTESQVLNVPIEDIIPNRFQPRLNFDETALNELAASIKEHGIIQPLVLRRLGDKYEIIAGERRYKASKLAGLTSVPAIISAMDDKKSAEVAIVENVQRKDLSAIEEAKSYKALLDKGYLTQEELAKKMGLSQSAISNKMRLLTLDESVQNALMEGKISERHARSLLKIEDKDAQAKWLQIIINERLTVQNLEKRLKEDLNGNDNTSESSSSNNVLPTNEIRDNPVNNIKTDEDEIPLVDLNPKIEDIKANATDIISSNNNVEEFIVPDTNSNSGKIPNKFFNFLEDESANMTILDSEPVQQVEEEIEMLDFLAPDSKLEENIESVNSQIDLTKANNLVDNLINNLKNENYQVELTKDDNSNEIKYTITIKKDTN